MFPVKWKHFFVLACIADISACSSFASSGEDFAVEHNLLGVRQCNAGLPEVSAQDVPGRGCATGAISDNLPSKEIPDEGKDQKEEAL